MLIPDRIKTIMKANQLSPSQFADKIGVQRSSLSHVLSGRNKPSLDFLSKIIQHFPKVNASWLITGEVREGEFRGEQQEVTKTTRHSKSPQHSQSIEKIVFFYKDGTFREFEPTDL